jgi:hypothetical protein
MSADSFDNKETPVAGAAEVGEATGRQVLRRVQINPEWLAFALVHAEMQALQFGMHEGERRDIALFIRGTDVLLALDLDKGHTRTADGRPREFRFRCSVNISADEGGMAASAGAYVPMAQLRGYLRNKDPHNGRFSVMSGDLPLTIEFVAESGVEGPAELVLLPPTREGRKPKPPRVIRTRGPASLEDFSEVEPVAAEGGLVGLRGEDAIEVGALCDPAIGAIILPDRGWLAAYHPDRIAAIRFASTHPEDETAQLPMFSEWDVPGAKENLRGRALDRRTVISGRLLIAGGFAQMGFESHLTETANIEIRRHQEAAYSAALAAAIVTAGQPALTEVHAVLGGKLAHKALLAAQQGSSKDYVGRAVVFARDCLREVPDAEQETFASAIAAAFPRAESGQGGALRVEAGGNLAVELIAGAYVAAPSPESLLRRVAEALGEVRAGVALSQQGDEGRARDSAVADVAVSMLDKETATALTAALAQICENKLPEWWANYASQLVERQVPKEVCELLTLQNEGPGKPRSVLRRDAPTAADVKLPDKAWADNVRVNARALAQGRFWRGRGGRVYVGLEDPRFGSMMVSDIPVQPNVQEFPLAGRDIADLTRSAPRDLRWKGEIWRSDLRWMANRIVGIADKDSEDPRNLWLLRWEPAGSPPAVGKITSDFPLAARLGSSPETGFNDGREFRRPRDAAAPVAQAIQAGRLSVFAFTSSGEKLYLKMPMRAAPSHTGEGPFAFAMDASHLHDLVSLAGRGKHVMVDVGSTGLRLYDPSRRAVVSIPTLSRSEVPREFRNAVAAAGVSEVAVAVDRPVIFGRAREMIERVQAAEKEARRAPRPVSEGPPMTRGPSVVWDTPPAPAQDAQVEVDSGPVSGALRERLAGQVLVTQRHIRKLERELLNIEDASISLFPDSMDLSVVDFGRAQVIREKLEARRSALRSLEAKLAELDPSSRSEEELSNSPVRRPAPFAARQQ